ncbi:DoxX family protein [Nocardia seriolae]|uniref:Membrane protein n=1 Tax=Nocardia seriolae TaxID=37332 RepID=A0A0B8NAZ2_9NOCA|nr:DoxX family protein [Nocardia seriolae]APB01190.1 Putative oxidoreductase MhqP [Nocardia seriolae]MTJ61307.1 DoxX family membrane protein [Nocardia seriolae]MTJ71719.1 DoxX family membrane protein [Nocardia seriolae]MTJ90569.1 DoxX family membrane protein [Nocardia seriolae]MTK34530.1 DoxX family membrane protein [Nocardia seriolae]
MTATLNTATSAAPAAASNGVSGADIGLLVARVGFGGLLAVHGSQKLFGWFNGYGLDATGQAFVGMGYDPGKFFATLAGLSEITGGLLLVLGLLTPLGAAIALGTMLNAINAARGGGFAMWELPAVYAIASVAFAFAGPGRLSLDHGRPWQRQGLVWGAAAVALAVVAALVTLAVK